MGLSMASPVSFNDSLGSTTEGKTHALPPRACKRRPMSLHPLAGGHEPGDARIVQEYSVNEAEDLGRERRVDHLFPREKRAEDGRSLTAPRSFCGVNDHELRPPSYDSRAQTDGAPVRIRRAVAPRTDAHQPRHPVSAPAGRPPDVVRRARSRATMDPAPNALLLAAAVRAGSVVLVPRGLNTDRPVHAPGTTAHLAQSPGRHVDSG